MDNITRDKIIEVFPEIKEINNVEIKEKVIQVWERALDINPWDDIEKIPFTASLTKDIVTLVNHTRAVTNHAMNMSGIIKKFYGHSINTDFVIAGAILHDVCKVVELSTSGGKSTMGNYTTHGVYGVHLCLAVGMPEEVTHIVASHTKQLGMPPKTIEAVIVHYCDNGDAQVIALKNGITLPGA
jgi:putative nucleotidyltransferase with HDIG domain